MGQQVSRQREWQKEQRAKHCCVICGKKAATSKRKGAGGFSQWCTEHLGSYREYMREYMRKRRAA